MHMCESIDLYMIYRYIDELFMIALKFLSNTIYLVEKQRDRVGERERKKIFHLLIHSPNGHNGHNDRGWTRLKLGTWNYIQISYMVVEVQVFRPPPLLSQAHGSELDWKRS